MSLEKAKIDGAIYDVIDIETFYQNPDAYGQYTAIKREEDGCVYPIRSRTDNKPGFYPTGAIDYFQPASQNEVEKYSQDNIINFRDATSLRGIISAQQKLMSAERSILTTIDNVFAPEIGENDTPEMRAMKEGIRAKHIDLDKYESRFGPNYNNDKRLLKKGNITFGKFRAIADALDMKATLILEDANPDVPNPIGRTITVELTGSPMEMEESE